MKNTAVISPCGKYRYWLTRGDLSKPLVFCMLNPSTADADTDDATIRRCIGFAETLGYTGIIVVNAFAYRATDPKELTRVADPFGPMNAHYLETAGIFPVVVCAWGSNKLVDQNVIDHLTRFNLSRLYCLGKNADGTPRHPLYLPNNTKLELFTHS